MLRLVPCAYLPALAHRQGPGPLVPRSFFEHDVTAFIHQFGLVTMTEFHLLEREGAFDANPHFYGPLVGFRVFSCKRPYLPPSLSFLPSLFD